MWKFSRPNGNAPSSSLVGASSSQLGRKFGKLPSRVIRNYSSPIKPGGLIVHHLQDPIFQWSVLLSGIAITSGPNPLRKTSTMLRNGVPSFLFKGICWH